MHDTYKELSIKHINPFKEDVVVFPSLKNGRNSSVPEKSPTIAEKPESSKSILRATVSKIDIES
jgi:hypothetical protein